MSSPAEEYDSYIVVSFINATLVLSIGETVEEVTDSGFLGTSPTLACSRLGEDALIQVIYYRCTCRCVHVYMYTPIFFGEGGEMYKYTVSRLQIP